MEIKENITEREWGSWEPGRLSDRHGDAILRGLQCCGSWDVATARRDLPDGLLHVELTPERLKSVMYACCAALMESGSPDVAASAFDRRLAAADDATARPGYFVLSCCPDTFRRFFWTVMSHAVSSAPLADRMGAERAAALQRQVERLAAPDATPTQVCEERPAAPLPPPAGAESPAPRGDGQAPIAWQSTATVTITVEEMRLLRAYRLFFDHLEEYILYTTVDGSRRTTAADMMNNMRGGESAEIRQRIDLIVEGVREDDGHGRVIHINNNFEPGATCLDGSRNIYVDHVPGGHEKIGKQS